MEEDLILPTPDLSDLPPTCDSSIRRRAASGPAVEAKFEPLAVVHQVVQAGLLARLPRQCRLGPYHEGADTAAQPEDSSRVRQVDPDNNFRLQSGMPSGRITDDSRPGLPARRWCGPARPTRRGLWCSEGVRELRPQAPNDEKADFTCDAALDKLITSFRAIELQSPHQIGFSSGAASVISTRVS